MAGAMEAHDSSRSSARGPCSPEGWQRVRFEKRCESGVKVPQASVARAAGVQSENDEWKCLTNSQSPRIARRKDNRWTYGSIGRNERREAYPGKSMSRKQDPHPA